MKNVLIRAARLLEAAHGIGIREAIPGWVEVRLGRALEALSVERGTTLEGVVDQLAEDGPALAELAEALRVGETRFYRDPAQWAALSGVLLPLFRERSRMRGLSVGCSTGEEAWTLAMLFAEAAAPFRVVGMDRSELALSAARTGLYPEIAARDLPRALQDKYLANGADGVEVRDALKKAVSFVHRDVMLGMPPGHYEVIVCKNMLIYFGEQARAEAVARLMRGLSDDGILLVARSEVPLVRALGYKAEEIAPAVTVFRP